MKKNLKAEMLMGLCMLMLGKAHIGEVQSSVWDQETMEICRSAGVELL